MAKNGAVPGTQPIFVGANSKNSQRKCVAFNSIDSDIGVPVSFLGVD